jgi:3D (Asp-Asp-Asp) domain-containing protein
MTYKKTVKLYFIILLVQIIILLSFIGFYIILIEKTVNPGVVSFDGSQGSSCESINEEFAGLVVAPNLEESDLKIDLSSGTVNKETIKKAKGQIMEISAYNLVESQCDNSPLIGVFGDNLMELMDQGIRVCASNAFLRGTKLQIHGFGECVVMDRMNSKYKNHVDICMRMDVEQALSFGRRNLRVSVIDK